MPHGRSCERGRDPGRAEHERDPPLHLSPTFARNDAADRGDRHHRQRCGDRGVQWLADAVNEGRNSQDRSTSTETGERQPDDHAKNSSQDHCHLHTTTAVAQSRSVVRIPLRPPTYRREDTHSRHPAYLPLHAPHPPACDTLACYGRGGESAVDAERNDLVPAITVYGMRTRPKMSEHLRGMRCIGCGHEHPVDDYPGGCPDCRQGGSAANLYCTYADTTSTGERLSLQGAISLGEADTPLFPLSATVELDDVDVWVKDESANPTG